MKQRYVSQFGETFAAYPSRSLRVKDDTWGKYIEIKNKLGKNHDYAFEQLINKYNDKTIL